MSNATTVLDRPTIEKLQSVIQSTVEKYQSDPESAQAVFRTKTRIVNGFQTQASAREFDLTIDEPEVLGGTNKGPNPVEVLLGALGTCQEIVIAAYAAALGIELESVEIEARGEIDLRGLFNVANVPSGFSSIRFDANIRAPKATPAQLQQLKALALAHCPVLDTLQRAVPVTNNYSFTIPTRPVQAGA